MSEQYILTLDLGTQSARAIIIDKHGNLLAKEQRKYKPAYESPKKGYCEQDPKVYFNYLSDASKMLATTRPDLMKNVAGVVLTTFRDTQVLLDENNNVLRPSILWLDQRLATYVPKIPLWKRILFGIVGMTPVVKSNQLKSAAHWIKGSEPEVWAKMKRYLNISTYFNFLLTNEFKDTVSNLTGHFPIDYKNGILYSKLNLKRGIFDIPYSSMCELIKPNEVIGYITKEASEITGIPEGLPLFGSGSDKSCESLGNGCIDPTTASISYGTASTVAITSKKYVEPSPFMPSYMSVQRDHYNAELQIYRGYWMLNWFKNEFCKSDSLEADILHLTTLDVLNKKMLEIGPGSDGLVLQPYWGPSLERPNSRGAIVGFSEKHTRLHLYRAIIEGIAYCLREGKEAIEKKEGKKVEYIVISGGGATSNAICQITADIFNTPVVKTHTVEASSLGAAICGFISLGVYKDEKEAKEHMIRYVERFEPNKENAAKYDELYKKVYTKMFGRLKGLYSALRETTNEKF